MPSSISYSSMPPKFPDKQRRPGLIHLPQPLATPPRPTSRLPALNPAEKPSQNAQSAPNAVDKLSVVHQLRTPSPSSQPPSSRPPRPQQSRRKQKRPSSAGVASNIADIYNNNDAPVVATEAGAVKPSSAVVLLSPPPTPATRASVKKNKNKPKGAAHGRKPSKTLVLPVSPPLTPATTEFKPAPAAPAAPVEEAVFSLESLLSSINSAQDGSSDSLPLAEDDEVIVWKQPQTPISLYPTPPPRAFGTPSRTPSPNELFNWEEVKNLPRLSPATIAQLKEQYDIRPSEAFLQPQQQQPSQEPDLLMSLLQSSSSCPPSPGSSPEAASTSFSAVSKPIPITRRVHAAHSRTPSVPTYSSSPGRSSMMQYREDVADLFGLDVRDVMAVQRATEAWRAYAGSAFNNSPETERVPAPKFLGRLFA